MPGNPFKILHDLYNKPKLLPSEVTQIQHLTSDDKKLIKQIGLSAAVIKRDFEKDLMVLYDRFSLYHQLENSLAHPLVGAAAELYGSYCSVLSHLHNCTVWVTSESPTYQRELTKLLDNLTVEEKIFDWAYSTGAYGDMFVKINGIPGEGIISVDDNDHPLNTSRVDHEGVLVGYYKTPQGQMSDGQRLMAPWEYVHFRLLGGKKRRPRMSDPTYSEFRTMHLMTGSHIEQVSTKYGVSLLFNALPAYRRLRLAEDSLLLARLSRGLIRYVWKLKVDSCLRGNTQISLLDGTTPTIREMAESPEEYIGKYTWTINEKTQEIETGQIKNVKKTRLNAELVRVHLDNSKYVDCTPDHPFLLRDGSYREAQYLKPDDSLMPLYTKLSDRYLVGYRMVYNPKKVECLLNHKVVRVEWLKEREDTYDIEMAGTPNFPLEAGVFVHNSNSEAVGELIDQYSSLLREARALNTKSDNEAYFDSKENPMSVIEDLFIPVWGEVGDLTFDKIGGEADIRWIKDIEDLRNQLSAALRVPLPLMGAYLKEATGPLGSDAIEKLDINFARIARKLQRSVRSGIKRICQIHLAYRNMDPDPNLFDVNMPEMSTAEEESLKASLKDGVDVVGSMLDTVDKVVEGSDAKVDKIEIFNYLNEKILKLEDFDLKQFITSAIAIPECKRRTDRQEHEAKMKAIIEKAMAKDPKRKGPQFSSDLYSYVPTCTHKNGELNESAIRKLGGWLGRERSSEIWEAKFGTTTVIEGEFDKDVEGGGQKLLPFPEVEKK